MAAGCFGGSGADPAQARPTAAFGDAATLTGVVTSEELLPVADAHVTVADLEPVATDPAGRFTVAGIPPGLHDVTVHAYGYAQVTRELDFAPGATVTADFTLRQAAGDEPYASLVLRTGIINCGVAIVLIAVACLGNTTAPLFGPSVQILSYEVPQGHQLTLAETAWAQSATSVSHWYYADTGQDETTGFVSDIVGKPPLRRHLDAGERHPIMLRDPVYNYPPFPPSDTAFTLTVYTFYQGAYQEEANETANAACQVYYAYCSGVGVGAEMRYDTYLTVFVNGLPRDARAYTALPDT